MSDVKTYDYQLSTDSGCSTAWEQEILVPIGTKIFHEYGLYKVTGYGDKDGKDTKVTANIQNVWCERIYGSKQ